MCDFSNFYSINRDKGVGAGSFFTRVKLFYSITTNPIRNNILFEGPVSQDCCQDEAMAQ
jgi:hypothetical protein